MNIILFRPEEVELPLPTTDNRVRHILRVLKRQVGESIDVGLLNGARGKATVQAIASDGSLKLSFTWGAPPAPLAAIMLLTGLPRPQTARDILRECTALGIEAMEFVRTERGEPSYAKSTLWSSAEWENLLVAGASQAFCTRLPVVKTGRSLKDALSALRPETIRLALDNYESPAALGTVALAPGSSVVLAVGSERGWSKGEREQLRGAGFGFVHLGERVLRTETACIAAITLLRAKLGLS